MNGANPNNPSGPVSEERLLDWVDGALTPEQEAALARASGRAEIAERIAQMRRHKSALARAGVVQAPADLHDRVLAAMERESLLGIAGGEGEIPRDTIKFKAPRTAWSSRLPHLAMAAGLTLLAGGLAYFGAVAWRAARVPLASNSGGPGATPGRTDEPRLAVADSPEATGLAAPGEPAEDAAAVRTFAASESAAAMRTPTAAAEAEPISINRAMELAAERRLAIRVRAREPDDFVAVERAGMTRTGDRQWSVSRDVTPHAASLLLAATVGSDPVQLPGNAFASAVFSAERLVAPLVGLGAGMPAPADARLARVRGTYMLDVAATERTLGVLRDLLRDRMQAHVTFEELGEPVESADQIGASDVLWWTREPSRWVERVRVPVLVESDR
ncbi:MAG TPA: hypothetical protein VD971_12725 [Phycisphaerales bacterium]|nr:hypothetical protein [Phycisphaerales bacterium]